MLLMRDDCCCFIYVSDIINKNIEFIFFFFLLYDIIFTFYVYADACRFDALHFRFFFHAIS